MAKKVLVSTGQFSRHDNTGREMLEAAGFEILQFESSAERERFPEVVAEYDAIILGANPFKTEDLRRCGKLKIIAKFGVGVDNIDLKTCKEMGVTVTNTPGANAKAVADLAFGMMLDLARGISLCNRNVHDGLWRVMPGVDVCEKTLGIVGLGAIGRQVARRARGFDMRVIAYDPLLEGVPEECPEAELVPRDYLFSESDIVTLHLPLNADTRNSVTKTELSMMKREAFLINTARGGIVNERDLYEIMKSGHLRGSAMDVTQTEPIQKDNPLLLLENVVITPHVGMATKEAENLVSVMCAENIINKFAGREIKRGVLV